MKIAIISDIHDNLENLRRCLNWYRSQNIKHLICCGDIYNSETLKYLAENFDEKINLVYGNMEIYKESELEQYDNINFLGRFDVTTINSKRIGICHEPEFIEKILEQSKCEVVFYGHTHRPWDERQNGVRIVNPGTLGGLFQKATFAVWDTETGELELKLVEKL